MKVRTLRNKLDMYRIQVYNVFSGDWEYITDDATEAPLLFTNVSDLEDFLSGEFKEEEAWVVEREINYRIN